MALEVSKTTEWSVKDMTWRLKLANIAFKASLGILSMRAQKSREITKQGIELAR